MTESIKLSEAVDQYLAWRRTNLAPEDSTAVDGACRLPVCASCSTQQTSDRQKQHLVSNGLKAAIRNGFGTPVDPSEEQRLNPFVRNTVRMWTATTWFLVLGGISLTLGGGVFVYELAHDKGFAKSVQAGAPVGAATIALLSFIATAVSLTANWRRQRRLDTLNAWNAWSDGTVDDRRLISDRLGMLAIPTAIAVALAEDKPYKDADIDLTDKAVRRETRTALVRILNGLERMAVGVEAAVYDQGTLRLVGGTIIIREYERGEAYVKARREAAVPELRQAAAYVWLESMVANLKSQVLKKDGVALDERRLEIMKGHRKR